MYRGMKGVRGSLTYYVLYINSSVGFCYSEVIEDWSFPLSDYDLCILNFVDTKVENDVMVLGTTLFRGALWERVVYPSSICFLLRPEPYMPIILQSPL